VAEAVARESGRALSSAAVRDRLLGIEAKELDIEVFAFRLKARTSLSTLGEVIHVGKASASSGKGPDVDFSLPGATTRSDPATRLRRRV
jgi:hypothetical protein